MDRRRVTTTWYPRTGTAVTEQAVVTFFYYYGACLCIKHDFSIGHSLAGLFCSPAIESHPQRGVSSCVLLRLYSFALIIYAFYTEVKYQLDNSVLERIYSFLAYILFDGCW